MRKRNAQEIAGNSTPLVSISLARLSPAGMNQPPKERVRVRYKRGAIVNEPLSIAQKAIAEGRAELVA